MAQSKRPGKSHQSPQVGWGALCDDLEQLVLSRLTLRDLASAAGTCRAFRKAFQSKLEQERAGLIAVAEESFGTKLFQALVPALQRSMHGHSPCPSLLSSWPCLCRPGKGAGRDDSDKAHILFTDAGETKHVTAQETWRIQYPDKPCAIISASEHLAKLFPGHWAEDCQFRPRSCIRLCEYGSDDGKYSVQIDEEGFGAILGLLLVVFTQNPEEQLASIPSPVSLVFWIRGWSERGADGRRMPRWMPHWEGEELLDLLRPLSKSIRVGPH